MNDSNHDLKSILKSEEDHLSCNNFLDFAEDAKYSDHTTHMHSVHLIEYDEYSESSEKNNISWVWRNNGQIQEDLFIRSCIIENQEEVEMDQNNLENIVEDLSDINGGL